MNHLRPRLPPTLHRQLSFTPPPPPLTILLHGFSGLRLQLAPTATHLLSLGHTVVNFAYASRTASLPSQAASLVDAVTHRASTLPRDTPLNFVTHSFGGLVLGAALPALPHVHRAVLVAPPLRGCALARSGVLGGGESIPGALQPLVGGLAKAFLGQGVGRDLGGRHGDWWEGEMKGWKGLEGRALVVTGNVGARNSLLEGDSDMVVRVEETVLPGRHWRTEYGLTHNALLYSPVVIGDIGKFLEGREVGKVWTGTEGD